MAGGTRQINHRLLQKEETQLHLLLLIWMVLGALRWNGTQQERRFLEQFFVFNVKWFSWEAQVNLQECSFRAGI